MTTEPQIFYKHHSTLRDTSKNTVHGTFMTNDITIPVFDFDGIVHEYSGHYLHHTPCSHDALYVDDEHIIFIEFKNGNVKEKNLVYKLYDSLLILFDKDMGLAWKRKDFESNITYSRANIDFILVYEDNDNNPRQKINASVSRLAKLGLGFVEGYLYHDMQVYTKKEFEQYFVQKYLLRYINA